MIKHVTANFPLLISTKEGKQNDKLTLTSEMAPIPEIISFDCKFIYVFCMASLFKYYSMDLSIPSNLTHYFILSGIYYHECLMDVRLIEGSLTQD